MIRQDFIFIKGYVLLRGITQVFIYSSFVDKTLEVIGFTYKTILIEILSAKNNTLCEDDPAILASVFLNTDKGQTIIQFVN